MLKPAGHHPLLKPAPHHQAESTNAAQRRYRNKPSWLTRTFR
jgi:hypothetical protein